MKCPKGEDECQYFEENEIFCPYAALVVLDETYLFPDCPIAPKKIWKTMKNREERSAYWKRIVNMEA